MTMQARRVLPTWAPRVAQQKIRRLYEMDARGICDEDMINQVGVNLLARCQSFVDAVEATRGRARCPVCSAMVAHTARTEELLHCGCGWELTWGEYFATIQHKQLSGAEPVLDQFRAYVAGFQTARTPRERMVLIDRLLHGFHWYYKTNAPTRPVAINLIEGRLNEVVAFLDDLSRGERSTAGVTANYAQWNKNIQANSGWYEPGRPGRAVRPAQGEP
jgi:hypothetical protein